MFALSEAVRGMLRTRYMTLISIVTITAALILFDAACFITFYAHGIVNKVRGSEEINVYLKDEMSDSDLLALDETIASMKEVKSTRIVSKEDAVREFENVFGEGLLSAMEQNPLPRSIEVAITEKFRSGEDMERFSRHISEAEGVESVEYGKDWVSKMDIFVLLFIIIEAFFVAFIVTACILVISNTITLTLIARKEAIEIMRLVGATDSFIRLPFYYEGLLQGLISGVLAFVSMAGAYWGLHYGFPDAKVYTYMFGLTGEMFLFKPLFISSIIPVGGFLGLLGSCVAVRRAV